MPCYPNLLTFFGILLRLWEKGVLPDRVLRPHSQLRHRAADRQVDDGRLHALLLGLHPCPVLPLLRHTGIICLLYMGQAIRDNI